MNQYSLLFAAVTLCSSGLPLAQGAEIKPLQVIDASCAAISAISLKPDGKQVFCFDYWTVHRVDLATGKKLPLPDKLRGLKIYTGIHVEKDVWLLAVSRLDFEIKADGYHTRYLLFDFATETIKADWAAHKDSATAITFAPKQDWLITVGTSPSQADGRGWPDGDHTVCFWDRKTLKKVSEMDLVKELRLPVPKQGEWICVNKIVIDPTATFLAVNFNQHGTHVLDLEKKAWHQVGDRQAQTLRFIDSRTLAISRLNTKFIAGRIVPDSLDHHCLAVYDWKASKELFQVDHNSIVTEPVPTADGKLMAFGDWRREGTWVRFLDVAASREIAVFKAYDRGSGMAKMIFADNGKKLITSGRDGILKVWDVELIVNPPKP